MNNDEPFTPESVDERIDQLLSPVQDNKLACPSTRVVQRLHALYEEDRDSAERVWEHLSRRVNKQESNRHQLEPVYELLPERTQSMQQTLPLSKQGKPSPFATVAAVLFTALLVSGLLWITYAARTSQTGVSANPLAGIYINEDDGVARLDIQTHQVIWHTTIAGRSRLDIQSAPVVIGDTVYIYYYNRVLAFSAETGTLRWSRSFNGGALNAPPYLVDGLLYVWIEGDDGKGGPLFALDPISGVPKATYQPPKEGWSSVIASNNILYYVSGSQTAPNTDLSALQLPSATPLWHRQVIQNPNRALGRISVADGVVYVTTMSIMDAPHYVFAFDVRTGTPIWQSPEIDAGFLQTAFGNEPLEQANRIYIATNPDSIGGGDLFVFDTYTHRRLWSKHLGKGDYSFVAASGELYVVASSTILGKTQENMMALNVSNGQVLWQKQFALSNMAILGMHDNVLYVAGWDANGFNGSVVFALKPGDGSVLWQSSIQTQGESITVV